MSPTPNRLSRRTLVRSAVTASAALALRPTLAFAEASASARIFVTAGDSKRHTEAPAVPLRPLQAGSVSDQIVVDLKERYQPILGFGSALTDASCFLLDSMTPETRQRFLADTFSPTAMNLSVGRTTIGASDYSRDVYSYDDTPGDSAMQHFSIAHDEGYILPMLREMRRLNPELFLLASPWSPPGWMKTYGSMLGGWMQYKSMAPYALYLCRYLEAYRAAGVPIQALTCQNEIETDQGGSMPATYWPPELESDFIRDHLGPMLRSRNDKVQVWLLDHNYNLWKRVRWQMQDPALRPFVDGVAWHGYLGTPDMMSRLHDAVPSLPFFWTEGGPDYTDPKYSYDWVRWGSTFAGVLSNGCRAIITWNLLLDQQGKPNIGPFSCGGLVTLNTDGSLTMSGQYWALRHLSQHVRRGALRLGSHTDSSELNHLAFANPDGSLVLVLTNSGEERNVRIVIDSREISLQLDRSSVSTVVV